ncbi:MAG: Response regulator of zinc sigma-54-dependent two-component system [Myxococcales bacterium]|nr:Response regulator of zinc sigma-54-dependent two-component system [Myxococcales bacterium]
MANELLRALVLEDERPTRNYLVELIEATKLAEVSGAVGTIDEAREALAGAPIDVVFVDLQLAATGDSRTGLDLIRAEVDAPGAPMFVIATAFQEHGIEAFKLGVVDYLLKPFSEERVEQCLRRLRARRPERKSGAMRVVARRKKNLVFVDPQDIWAFEAIDRLTYVHSRVGKLDIDLSLIAIEASFGRTLTRVHRNWLVNLALVQEMDRDSGELTLIVGTTEENVHVPVSRDRARAVRDLLLQNATGLRRP